MSSITKQSYLQKVLKSVSIQHKGFRYFAERYLQHLSIAELEQLKPSEINDLLNEGWTFLQSWTNGTSKISVRNLSSIQTNTERGTAIQLLMPNLPFVADSIITEIRRQGYDINFILRGNFHTNRDKGLLKDLISTSVVYNEMLLHIELRQQIDLETLDTLEKSLLSIISEIQLAIDDFDSMRSILEATKTQLVQDTKPDEASFLEWIGNDHFIFLGVAELHRGNTVQCKGILKQSDIYANILQELATTSSKIIDCIRFHKPSFTSKIDRHEPLDILRIHTDSGKEIVFVGILTYAAKSISFDQIPYISKKLTLIIDYFNTFGEYFNPKDIITTINHLPFTEIMNLSVEEITNICKAVLSHKSKYVVLTYPRFDPVLKQTSVLIFIHPDKLNDHTRSAIKMMLSDIAGSSILHYEADYIDNDLTCLYIILPNSKEPHSIFANLSDKIAEITLSWEDQLRSQLIHNLGLTDGKVLSRKYAGLFKPSYQQKYPPQIAAQDVLKIEELAKNNLTATIEIYSDAPSLTNNKFHLKFFKEATPFALFELFTVLDSLNLKLISEASFELNSTSMEKSYWIQDLLVEPPIVLNFDEISAPFKQLCQKILSGDVSNDNLNSLVLNEALNYRQITLIKAFLSYLKQIQFPFGGKYNRDILLRNSNLTRLIIQLFEAKFNPSIEDEERVRLIEALNLTFDRTLKELKTEDEDKLFRQLYNLITHILRTNYFVSDKAKQLKPYISFKIDSGSILDIPLPAPRVEIFVYAKEFEAVHLRYGKVSRGGIRWSDRGEDYRTEVLGLVKAQNTKNAVIVPMGSKGGFYLKKTSPTQGDAIECYKNMMRGMLDITDNLIEEKIVNPAQVIRYDEDDPYLVVAADKGTASFSDIANSISAEYNFWLKDAFASGGSAGYDHKKMAITSKGAWESVKQHCKEVLNIDPESDIITAVGVGDMSGDVFGNGLLRSKTIQLKAAFNHQHIFIDPSPDISTSYSERERLFNLPRSTWMDYDQSLLSNGGMIIERSSKTVTLTSEAKALLGLTQDVARPSQIMRAILKADVDLIWLGGIGTYIKASSESDESVSDRANDTIRINGQEVCAKIIAEGANLGCTQRGRIEYALTRNGRINTDFIDNSGGVDCSDHEVNIKILLNHIIDKGGLTLENRNALLKEMTEAVGHAVTSENVLQNLTLSYAAHYSNALLDEYSALTQYLSLNAGLNPSIEFLPTVTEFNERQKLQQGLTRPELAILMSYTKNHLKTELLKTSVLDTPYLNDYLTKYFPDNLNIYTDQMSQHPLKQEIIVTKLTSQIVDRLGIHFVHRLIHQTGKSISDILNAYIVVKDFFNLDDVWAYFDSILSDLTYENRIDFIHSVSDTVYNGCAWFLMFAGFQIDIHTHCQQLHLLFKEVKNANLLLSPSNQCKIPSDKHTNLNAHIHTLQQRLTTLQLSIYHPSFNAKELELFEHTFTHLQFVFNFDLLHQILKSIPNTTFWGQLFVLSTQLELERLHGYLTKSICISILAKRNSFDTIIAKYQANIDWLSHMIQQTMTNAIYDPAAVTVIMRHLDSLVKSITETLEHTK